MLNKKYKFAVLFIAMLLVLGLTLPACTCQKPTETEKLPAPPGEPAALSFEAAEYVNADPGFSVKYPKEWVEQPATGVTVFYAAAPAQVPNIFISVVEGAAFADALNAAISGAGGAEVKIKTESETKLADGTKAYQAVYKFKHPAAPMALDAFSLGAVKADKWVVVTVATVGLLAKYDEAKFSEIAHTLKFK